MLFGRLSWTVRNSFRVQGSPFVCKRYIQGSGDKWVNLRSQRGGQDHIIQYLGVSHASDQNIYHEIQNSNYKTSEMTSDQGLLRSLNVPRLRLQVLPTIGPVCPSSNDHLEILARSKKDKGKGKGSKGDDSDKEDSDDDDDDDDEIDDLVPVDYVDLDLEAGSMRLDTVMKISLPMARKKIDEVHVEDKIRVNGERVQKRSMDINEGDVIDLIYGRNRENINLLDVRRVKILSVPEYKTAKDRVKFKVRRWPNLTIENYTIHPFESMVLREVIEDTRKQRS